MESNNRNKNNKKYVWVLAVCLRSHTPFKSLWQQQWKVGVCISDLFLPQNLVSYTNNTWFFKTYVWICCLDHLQLYPRLMPTATFSFQVGMGLDSAEKARSCYSLSRRSFLPNFFTEGGLQCTTLAPLGKLTSCLLCSLCLFHVFWSPVGQRSSGQSLDSMWERNSHKRSDTLGLLLQKSTKCERSLFYK